MEPSQFVQIQHKRINLAYLAEVDELPAAGGREATIIAYFNFSPALTGQQQGDQVRTMPGLQTVYELPAGSEEAKKILNWTEVRTAALV